MSVNMKVIVTRTGAGLAAAAGLAAKQPDLLHSLAGRVTLALIFVFVAIPWAPENAGVLRPASPGQVSLAESIGAAVQTLISTPAAARRQKAKDIAVQGFQAVLSDPVMREKLKQELTSEFQRDHLWQPGQPVPTGAQSTTAAPAPTFADPSITPDPAIKETGGNQ